MGQGLEGLLSGHTLVKRYQIEDVVGRGGFAVVYRATDTRLGRPVAVKVITLTAEDPEQREELRQRLHREARAAASLPHHPHLVTVHDVGTDPQLGLDFLVMELLQGENLSQALQRGRPPLARALRILRDAAEGLAIGHRAGLVHRDVKPGNIFLAQAQRDNAEAYRVCLLDYGIAQAIEDDQTVTRGMGANPLSPAFASPEQLQGDRELSAATDVFSLGVVGYQLLTGERPFAAQAGQVPTGWTVRAPIRELNPEVSPAVEQVVMRAMSVNPADRYRDADGFADALDVAMGADDVTQGLAARVSSPGLGALPPDFGLTDDGTVLAPPPRRPGPAPAAGPTRPVPPLRPPSHAAPRTRSKLPVILVVAVLLAAAAAWAALSGGGGDADGVDDARETAEAVDTDAPAVVVDDAGVPVQPRPVQRTGADVDVPRAADGSPAAPATGGAVQPSAPAAQPAQQPAAQPQQPAVQQPQQPAQPQPPAARPPAQQPSQPPAQQPARPPVQQPPPQQPEPQPTPPPVVQPPARPARPDPPVLGLPAPPRPDAPRDTIFIGTPGRR